MALCVQVLNGVLVPDQSAPDVSQCQMVILSGPELASEAFDSEVFAIAVGGTLAMWAVGLGVGLLINILRRARL